MKIRKGYLWLLGLTACCTVFLFPRSASAKKITNAYDISQYQGYLNQNQANNLKHETNFMILRAQGGDYQDSEINHNEQLMDRAHIPYGVYSYSYYTNPVSAENEAKELYTRSPHANFYANDIEENNAGNTLNQSTYDWAKEIHRLTPKPAIIYSGEYFMNTNISQRTRNEYNGVWLAAYGPEPDTPYHYDLWQDKDNQYSPTLNEYIDSDVFPDGTNKPLSFWEGHNVNNSINNNSNNVNANESNMSSNNSNNNYEQANAITPIHKYRHHHHHYYRHYQQHHVLIMGRTPWRAHIYLKAVMRAVRQQATLNNNDVYAVQRLLNIYKNNLNQIKKQHIRYHNRNLTNLRSQVSYDNKLINRLVIKQQSQHKIRRRQHKHLRNYSILHNYYHSSHIHTLKVMTHRTQLYTIHHHLIGYLHRGQHVRYVHFRYVRWHHHLITRAIGLYHRRLVEITSNKKYVRA